MADQFEWYTAFRVLRRNTLVAIFLYTAVCNIVFACILGIAFTASSAVVTPLSDWITIAIACPPTFFLFSTPLIAHLKLRRSKRSGLIFAAIASLLFILSPFALGLFFGTIPTLRSVLFVRKIPTDQWFYGP